MDDLWEILDTVIIRKLILLEQIKDARDYISVQTLADKNHWERRTVLGYVDSLLEDSCSYDHPELTFVKKENMIRITYTDYKDFRSLYLYILENSLPVQILERLLLGESVSLNDCLNKYFISESTFKRRLKPLKSFLLKYDLELSRQAGIFTLVGREHRIRMFAYNFFWKLYRGRKWPFPTIDEKKVTAVSNYLLEEFSYAWNETNEHQIRYVLAVNLTRYRKGLKIEFTEEQLHMYFTQDYLDEPKPWLHVYQLPEEEVMFFFLLAQTQEKFLSISIFKEPVLTFHKETRSDIYKATEMFFNYFSEMIFPLSEQNKEDFYVYIFADHFFCAMFNHFPVGMSGFASSWVIEERFPILTEKLDRLINRMKLETDFPLLQNRNFLLPRYALFFSLLTDISSFEEPITIYFDTGYPELLEGRLVDSVYDYFHNDFNLVVKRSTAKDSEHHADLILTTSLVPMENIHADYTIYLLDILRSEDIERIEHVLQEIRENRAAESNTNRRIIPWSGILDSNLLRPTGSS
ncbi:helix-turn-helix domain-containing protein [Enterococcus larvae]|uniref:helix-turn-helix domain-containing protein n=1 Tax=Enterococcus larvae TaxID=2794352 RepID=UPI003F3840B6